MSQAIMFGFILERYLFDCTCRCVFPSVGLMIAVCLKSGAFTVDILFSDLYDINTIFGKYVVFN